jgi:hypothetical protein
MNIFLRSEKEDVDFFFEEQIKLCKSSLENYISFRPKSLESFFHGIEYCYKIINTGYFKGFSDIIVHGTQDDAAIFAQKGSVGFKNYM